MAQWWEHSPSTNAARVRILASTPYVGWVCCWLSPLLREVFLRVLRFSPFLKNQHFQIPIRSGTHGHVSTSSYELLSDPWVSKLQFTIYNFFLQGFATLRNVFKLHSDVPKSLRNYFEIFSSSLIYSYSYLLFWLQILTAKVFYRKHWSNLG